MKTVKTKMNTMRRNILNPRRSMGLGLSKSDEVHRRWYRRHYDAMRAKGLTAKGKKIKRPGLARTNKEREARRRRMEHYLKNTKMSYHKIAKILSCSARTLFEVNKKLKIRPTKPKTKTKTKATNTSTNMNTNVKTWKETKRREPTTTERVYGPVKKPKVLPKVDDKVGKVKKKAKKILKK